MRKWSATLKRPKESEGRTTSNKEALVVVFVWMIGLIATIYLLGNALYLLFLAIVFGQYSPHTPALEYLAFVAENSIPTVCFLAIGVVGLCFWPSRRSWFLGLLAVLVQTALAIYVFADPKAMLNLVP